MLTVIAGPAAGCQFSFAETDTFLVGRSRFAHFQVKDKYLSSVHFMMDLAPPHCRLIDLDSHNGTFVNGDKVTVVDLRQGDQIRAGHSTFRLSIMDV